MPISLPNKDQVLLCGLRFANSSLQWVLRWRPAAPVAAGPLNSKGELVMSNTFSINRKQLPQQEDLIVSKQVQEVVHARTALQVCVMGCCMTDTLWHRYVGFSVM